MFSANIRDNDLYDSLQSVLKTEKVRDDLISICAAVGRSKNSPNSVNILGNGPLPASGVSDFRDTYFRGLAEVERFLISENVLAS